MANSLPDATNVMRDEAGVVRRISHARSPYLVDGFVPASAATLGQWYLARFGGHFGLQSSEPAAQAAAGDRTEIELKFDQVKPVHDQTAIALFAQLHAGIPVFQAGLSLKIRADLSAIISATSTLHLDIGGEGRPALPPSTDGTPIDADRLRRALQIEAKPEELRIEAARWVIYRYDPDQRFDPDLAAHDQPESTPRLDLPPVPDGIIAGRHYAVVQVDFQLALPRWGLLHWRALVSPEGGAVLYLRAFVESCTGNIFRDDPPTISGDLTHTPCAAAAVLDPLAETVALQGLVPPPIAGDPQSLRGEFIEIVDTDPPAITPPTAPLPAGDFGFSAPTDEFAAVSAYHHMDALYRMVAGMGFANYFPGTTFPIPTDPWGENGAVNAHHFGTGNSTTKYTFGHAQGGCPVGIACDRRVVIHEFGHSVLRNHIDSGTFTFAHGVGDTMAVILSDPNSAAPDRFDTFPFTAINRRHDRDVAGGWGWGGANDTGSYSSEQILSTTLFRAYRSLGGDSGTVAERQFAATYVTYLMLAAVAAETPLTQPNSPEDLAEDIIEADLTTASFAGHPGGAFHKVVRWAFEEQDAYGGEPPEVDIYIDDGRAGEYPWLADLTKAPDLWVRREPDGGTTHEAPWVGTPAYVYARIRNRGTAAATGIIARGFSGPGGGAALWPDQFVPLATPVMPVAAPLAPGGSVIVGPFEWTPPESTAGVSILMSTSAPDDVSNIETVAGSLETRRLVPFDNNLAQRDVAARRYPAQYSVKFVCGSPGPCGGECGGPVAPGSYFTAINILNASDRPVRFRRRIVVALPGGRAGHASAFTFGSLDPYQALEIECPDIYRDAGLPGGCFLKGFVVIESVQELDIVAVYTAAGKDGQVETLDIEYIRPRLSSERPPNGEPRRPDLVPEPPFPPPPPNDPLQLPQNFCFSTTGGRRADAVRIRVRNQGDGDAPASVTRIVFRDLPPVDIATPPIPAGGDVHVEALIPREGCYVGEAGCPFRITVDATSLVNESDETNNSIDGACIGIVS